MCPVQIYVHISKFAKKQRTAFFGRVGLKMFTLIISNSVRHSALFSRLGRESGFAELAHTDFISAVLRILKMSSVVHGIFPHT